MLQNTEEDRVRNSLLIKADFWSYEEEWRIIETQGPGGPYDFNPQFLNGVILGARISPENRAFVLEAVSERLVQTEVLQAGVDSEVFRISLRPAGT